MLCFRSGRCEAPGVAGYYGAFLLDGEGNNVEAVCFR